MIINLIIGENVMDDLLKEAIADAKAVRETALQNAKAALEEAFTPQIKSMLSAKLSETEDSDEDDTEEMESSEEEDTPDEDEDDGEEYIGGDFNEEVS